MTFLLLRYLGVTRQLYRNVFLYSYVGTRMVVDRKVRLESLFFLRRDFHSHMRKLVAPAHALCVRVLGGG